MGSAVSVSVVTMPPNPFICRAVSAWSGWLEPRVPDPLHRGLLLEPARDLDRVRRMALHPHHERLEAPPGRCPAPAAAAPLARSANRVEQRKGLQGRQPGDQGGCMT